MPSDDVILNLRQIAGYASLGVQPTDMIVMQRGGLGGAYVSAEVDQVVATALSTGELPMQVGLAAPFDAEGGQVFAGVYSGPFGQHFWNAYAPTAGPAKYLTSGAPAAMFQADPSLGWCWEWATPGTAGATVQFQTAMAIDPTGYVNVSNSVLLGRDPIAPLEAATAQWVLASTVTSINGVKGDIALTVMDVLGAAPLHSPRFTGCPTAPTMPPWTCNATLATTAFVQGQITRYLDNFAKEGVVTAFNGRTGDIVLTAADITAADPGYAPLLSPEFEGNPTAPTPAPGDASGNLATTAFVMNAVAASVAGVASFMTRTGAVVLTAADVTSAGGALLSSPAFVGNPTAPTPMAGNSSTSLATTAFVAGAVAGMAFAPLASPAFTGTPTAPVAAPGTSTSQLATTSFVQAAVQAAVAASVTSFNGRTGAVSLTANDISAAGGASQAFVAANYLPLTGGTIVGPNGLFISQPWPTLVLNKPSSGTGCVIQGETAGLIRWVIELGDNTAETGGGGGSDFSITRYNDAGAGVDIPLAISRSSGAVYISTLGVAGPVDVTSYGISYGGQAYIAFQAPNGLLQVTYYAGAPNCVVQGTFQNGVGYAAQVLSLNISNGQMYCDFGAPGSVAGQASWATSFSDRRLKSKLVPAFVDALKIVNDLKVWACDMRPLPESEPLPWDCALIADEVEPLIPRAYIAPMHELGMAGLAPLPLIATLIKAMQQLSARIETLEARLA